MPSESFLNRQAASRVRAVWFGLAIVTACICTLIFGLAPPFAGNELYIAIGLFIVATLSGGFAAYAITMLGIIEIELVKTREKDRLRRLEQLRIDDLPDLEDTPPPSTEESEIVLWDEDPTTEEEDEDTEEVLPEEVASSLLPPAPPLHKGLLAFACMLAFFLQLTLIYWYIEDAAISFAYAKHFAAGEGLVTYPGGERVEGYSNPLWTALIAIGYLLGISGFQTAKTLALTFGVLTVPIVYTITRHLRPHRRDATPLIAAFLTAGNAQFAIWGAAGLENSLFNFLLALGIWQLIVEVKRPHLPYSALIFFALAITRPEGILYAAFAGFWLFGAFFNAECTTSGCFGNSPVGYGSVTSKNPFASH